MKAYTDIEQSMKLAEILPIERADMYWFVPADKEGEFIEEIKIISNKSEYYLFEGITDWNDTPYIPAWSLAALLDAIPQEIFNGEYVINITEGHINKWVLTYDHCVNRNHSNYGLSSCADNLIDACVEMIVKLHKQNLL